MISSLFSLIVHFGHGILLLSYPPVEFNCGANSFYDQSQLRCMRCPDNSVTNYDNLEECVCQANSLQEDSCTLKEKQDGKCVFPQCSPTFCRERSLAVSRDKSYCLPCGGRSMYNDTLGECICPEGWRLLEIYGHNTSRALFQDCIACPAGTAVIQYKMLRSGQTLYSTAGAHFIPNPFSCASCPPGMEFNKDKMCICKENHVLVGEVSIGPQMCIAQSLMPSITTSPSRIKFYYLPDGPLTFESITLSHYYLQAASRCEYYDDGSLMSIRACQTLLNLCVMSFYDRTSAPCKQLEAISTNRQELMDKLFYKKNINDIIQDSQSVKMKMSLKQKDGFENLLDFRLAKYSLSGEFKGFEPLRKHFHSFFDGSMSGRRKDNTFGIAFGQNVDKEQDYDLTSILEEESFFYELYLVDKGSNCGNDACLIPIPVKVSNNGLEVNDFATGSEISNNEEQIYVKRFVLVDNMVGFCNTVVLSFLPMAQNLISSQSSSCTSLVCPLMVWKSSDTPQKLLFKQQFRMTIHLESMYQL